MYTINDFCASNLQNRRPFASTYGAPAAHAEPMQVLCDTKDGWLVILRRKSDASPLVNFQRGWVEYENGFGDLNSEFWYGLKNIYCLTQIDDVELMVELKRDNGTAGVTWTYQNFQLDGPETRYTLNIGQAERTEGTVGDFMAYHNGYPFATTDKDTHSCANTYGGGWWYNSCFDSALTCPHSARGNIHLSGFSYYPYAEMKIRPKSCVLSYKKTATTCD